MAISTILTDLRKGWKVIFHPLFREICTKVEDKIAFMAIEGSKASIKERRAEARRSWFFDWFFKTP